MVNKRFRRYKIVYSYEIAEQPEQFKMAIVIGNVLGKYQLGISDVWISNRIDKMLEDGVLKFTGRTKGKTNYRRILRKRMKLNNHSTNRCYMEANKPCNSGFSLPFFPLADRRSHFL